MPLHDHIKHENNHIKKCGWMKGMMGNIILVFLLELKLGNRVYEDEKDNFQLIRIEK